MIFNEELVLGFQLVLRPHYLWQHVHVVAEVCADGHVARVEGLFMSLAHGSLKLVLVDDFRNFWIYF